jgi:hypothetical protein
VALEAITATCWERYRANGAHLRDADVPDGKSDTYIFEICRAGLNWRVGWVIGNQEAIRRGARDEGLFIADGTD